MISNLINPIYHTIQFQKSLQSNTFVNNDSMFSTHFNNSDKESVKFINDNVVQNS